MRIRSYSGAGVMLFRYNSRYNRFEVLLGKRALPRGYGKWAIIGGGKSHGDGDYYDCALREFLEETGVDLRSVQTKTLAVRRINVPYYHWRTFLVLTWGYFPEFDMNSENSELKWFPVSTVSRQDLWLSLDRELRAFRHLVKKHALVIAHHTGMPFEDGNLLEAYRLLTHMKVRNPDTVRAYLMKHMDIGDKEAERLSRRLGKYYAEEAL